MGGLAFLRSPQVIGRFLGDYVEKHRSKVVCFSKDPPSDDNDDDDNVNNNSPHVMSSCEVTGILPLTSIITFNSHNNLMK